MTIGIYSIYWDNLNEVYIGQSIHIEERFKSHIRLLKNNNHYNCKLQDYFIKYAEPSLIILEECSLELLDNKEEFYIKEFDSFNNGLNLVCGPMSVVRGENHPGSKYSDEVIIKVFLFLHDRKIPHKEISNICKVHLDVVKGISRGYSHCWLQEVYPTEYKEMLSTKKDKHNNGEIHSMSTISNEQAEALFKDLVERKSSLKDISLQHNISYAIVNNMAFGTNYKWLESKYPIEYAKMLSNKGKVINNYPKLTNGIEIIQVDNAMKFCRERGLDSSNLSSVFNGKRKSHKGWRIYNE